MPHFFWTEPRNGISRLIHEDSNIEAFTADHSFYVMASVFHPRTKERHGGVFPDQKSARVAVERYIETGEAIN